MTTSRYELFSNIFDEEQSREIKGFLREDIDDLLKTKSYKTITIPPGMEYRPDIISNVYFGSPKLFWILVYINKIEDSPEGFYLGREIMIPDINKIKDRI